MQSEVSTSLVSKILVTTGDNIHQSGDTLVTTFEKESQSLVLEQVLETIF